MRNDLEKIVILPDIHGRTFWKWPLELFKDNDKVGFIFLGDYLDPYDFDGITKEDALNNFYEMRKAYSVISKDRIEWLFGNHDFHYFKIFHNGWGCRRNSKILNEINDYFQNHNEFKIAYEHKINNKRYIFTHAGIRPKWGDSLVYTKLTNDREDIWNVDFINSLMNSNSGKIRLNQISRYRGGWEWHGSPLWADIEEHLNMLQWEREDIYQEKNIYQVFAHNLSYPSIYEYTINDCFAMLDCELPFIIDIKTGEIKKLIDYIRK